MALKNPLLVSYIVVDFLALLSGLGILAVVLMTQMSMKSVKLSTVAQDVLLQQTPLTGTFTRPRKLDPNANLQQPALLTPS
jgi:hypothetical protein